MQIQSGKCLPYGVSRDENGVNFSIYSKHAQGVTLRLYDYNSREFKHEIILDPHKNKTGNVWHVQIDEPESNLCYAYHMSGPPDQEEYHQFSYDPEKPLLDPYAKEVSSGNQWGVNEDSFPAYATLDQPAAFDWEGDQLLQIPQKDMILYKMHVRGLTQDASSKVQYPGTYLGVIEKIPYLKELGINAVELQPIFEFNECENWHTNPKNREPLYNYWGYSPLNYFAPMKRYASSNDPNSAVQEFKAMVKEFHRNQIEVILDVVYNHTGEGVCGAVSFKGIENPVYYMLDEAFQYRDFTGCGNTLNNNHPIVRDFILQSLRYWVLEMHVDGFRFDLASIMTRGTKGNPLSNPPLLEEISNDPVLANVKLIAEPWDAVGLYHVGGFYPQVPRWSEWNGKYRDTLRRFISGQKGQRGECATRISGSQDLYGHGRKPYHSLNFISIHDGFTLADLCAYNNKHNEDNGEDNRDGTNNNDSWNCGAEGSTEDEAILEIRQRQMRNFHLALMVSLGVPMLFSTDEYGHTKNGNNNTWCQDNELNWFQWDSLKNNEAFYRYYKGLVQFRRDHNILRKGDFYKPQDIQWHGWKPGMPEWDKDTPFLAFTLYDRHRSGDIYVAFNADSQSSDVVIPNAAKGMAWHWIANSSEVPPNDFFEEKDAPMVKDHHYVMKPYSSLMLKAQKDEERTKRT